MAMLPGIAVARLGCFASGCCHGIPTNVPWAITFKSEFSSVSPSLLEVPIHPTQLYESLLCIIGFIFLRKVRSIDIYLMPQGAIFILAISYYGLVRFIVEFWRYSIESQPLLGLKCAQILSIINVLLALVLLLHWRNCKELNSFE